MAIVKGRAATQEPEEMNLGDDAALLKALDVHGKIVSGFFELGETFLVPYAPNFKNLTAYQALIDSRIAFHCGEADTLLAKRLELDSAGSKGFTVQQGGATREKAATGS